jgi:RNA polymerase sigma factor (sigma-70 family)
VKADWETLHRARAGDDLSWQALWRAHQPRLKALAYLITGSTSDAEDIAEETLIRAMTATIRNSNGTLHGFLGTIAYRLAVKEARRGKRHMGLDGLDAPDDGAIPLESMVESEQKAILAECIRSLSSEHREALVLKFYSGLSYDGMAAALGIPVDTMRSRVFYAVQACRKKMHEKGILK